MYSKSHGLTPVKKRENERERQKKQIMEKEGRNGGREERRRNRLT